MQYLNSRAIAAYALVFGLVVLMTGCGGGESSADKKAAATVTQVEISPSSSISLVPGEVVQLLAAALNASGNQVFTQTITFNSSNPQIQIGVNNGRTLLCAGTWDNTSNAVVCTPIVIPNPQTTPITSNITASAGGVNSPTTIASVHLAITNVVISPSNPACVTEKGTQVFTADAYNGANKITDFVGTFNWISANSNVATIPPSGDTGHTNQATATAVHPGQTNITASIGNVTPNTSAATVFTQCLVKTISVSVSSPVAPEDTTHFTVATGANRALTVIVTDSTGAPVTTLPSLTWTSTQSSIAAVAGSSTGANVNGGAPGVAAISASCLPNACNIGTNVSVTSNSVSGTVTGAPATSATAYVTCNVDDHAAPTPVCTTVPSSTSTATQTQLFPINGTTLGTAINLPHTPTTMVINQQKSRIYLGSTAGLMVVDANANTFSSTVTNAPGDVLAVAPNGNAVAITSGNDVFLYNGNSVTTLLNGGKHVIGATAAAFSPDSGKLLVSSNLGTLWFESAGTTPNQNTSVATATSIAWFPSGQFGAVSRNGSTDYIDQNPDATNAPVVDSSQTCGGLVTPLGTLAATTPPADQVLAANPAGTMCLLNTSPGIATFGVTPFTASQLLTSADATHAYLLGGAPSIQDYTIGTTTMSPITLAPAATVTTGGIATNNTIYAGADNNTVHVFTFAGGLPTGAVTETVVPTTIPANLVVVKR